MTSSNNSVICENSLETDPVDTLNISFKSCDSLEIIDCDPNKIKDGQRNAATGMKIEIEHKLLYMQIMNRKIVTEIPNHYEKT